MTNKKNRKNNKYSSHKSKSVYIKKELPRDSITKDCKDQQRNNTDEEENLGYWTGKQDSEFGQTTIQLIK